MGLTRITKGVIKPNEDYQTGIITATGLDVNGDADVSGNLSVGGVLTYEDVTSIDSVGIITAQKDIHVGAGVSIVGIVTAATGDFVDLDVDGHTNLDNVSISGVTTIGDVVVGGATTDLIVNGDARVTGILSIGTGTVVIDETTVKTGTSNLHSIGIEIAGINVLGADTPIGSGSTIYNSGAAVFTGIVTAGVFYGDGSNLSGITAAGTGAIGGLTVKGTDGTVVGTAGSISSLDFSGSSGLSVIASTGAAGVATVTVLAELVSDTSPQLGGNLDLLNKSITGTGHLDITGNTKATGISTALQFKTGTSNLHNVGIEIAGVNVLGADTPIGAGATIFNSGDIVAKAGAEFQGIVTATSFVGDGANLTNTGASLSSASSGTERVVLTNLTSGTMISAKTDPQLTFNYATNTLSASVFSGSGSGLSSLNATNLSSGTVPIARLGDSGTKNSGTFLAGDNTFKTVTVAINSIAGDSNNRVLTSDGDGTATAESNLTFDGTTLQLGSGTKLDLSSNDSYLNARVMRNESGGSDDGMYIGYGNANSGHTRIYGGGQTSGGISVQGSGNGDCYINGNVIWNSGNDGSGTGLDSDTVDGIHGGSFLRSDTNDTLTKGSTTVFDGSWNDWLVRFTNNNGSSAHVYMCHHDHGMHIRNDSSTTSTYLLDVYAANGNRFRVRGADAYTTINGNQVWHAGNDGGGSGLDSDLLDGNHGSWYRDYNNLTNKPSTATVLYIDVYGQGNAGDRDTARNWATSAVSIPNNTMFVVRWNRVYSYWVNNNTASGNEDRKTLWIKNSSGSIYWAGADST
jgi:hypothetical protein